MTTVSLTDRQVTLMGQLLMEREVATQRLNLAMQTIAAGEDLEATGQVHFDAATKTISWSDPKPQVSEPEGD